MGRFSLFRRHSVDNGIIEPKVKPIQETDIIVLYKCYCCLMKSEMYITKKTSIVKCPNCGVGMLKSNLRKKEE